MCVCGAIMTVMRFYSAKEKLLSKPVVWGEERSLKLFSLSSSEVLTSMMVSLLKEVLLKTEVLGESVLAGGGSVSLWRAWPEQGEEWFWMGEE